MCVLGVGNVGDYMQRVRVWHIVKNIKRKGRVMHAKDMLHEKKSEIAHLEKENQKLQAEVKRFQSRIVLYREVMRKLAKQIDTHYEEFNAGYNWSSNGGGIDAEPESNSHWREGYKAQAYDQLKAEVERLRIEIKR